MRLSVNDEGGTHLAGIVCDMDWSLVRQRGPDATATPAKQIRGWDCRKYIVEMGWLVASTTTEIWATEEIKGDEMWPAFQMPPGLMEAFGLPGMENAAGELAKIKGVQVLVISSVAIGGKSSKPVRTTEELVEIKQITIPDDLFEIPEGYVSGDDPYA